ncbi:testis-expressed sequence 264 protein [Poecilia reticulata]|uniref:Testis expressed 264, ER-phagy receptor a n=1 Tax=Poecilia reticulata TaxID=8081 RepID=A0A3P9NX33_POERE|nr:PREDICTED: testis-expressed sequence 264 protein [Poecilia reticulata]
MSDSALLLLILFLLLCLVLTVGGLLVYSGLLSEVVVKTGAPPIRNVTVAYKFKQGAYKDCGAAFTETYSIGPNLRPIGIFYDDPKKILPEKCRYVVGSVLCEGEEKPDEELLKLYEKFGFKVFSLPEVSHAVTTTFPCTTSLSHVLAAHRVYRELGSYIEERKLCAFPFIETFHSNVINYMAPLCRQMDFYVPELTEQVKTDGKDEDSDEDRGTDITGADSHSDVSSVSGGVPWDSRETSLAASTAASLASSLPLRDIMDSNEDNKHREHSDRGSNDSVGSGSSFEELDMDQEELEEGDGMEGEKEKGTPEEEEEEEEEEEKEGAEEEAGLVAKRKFLGDGEE